MECLRHQGTGIHYSFYIRQYSSRGARDEKRERMKNKKEKTTFGERIVNEQDPVLMNFAQ